MKLTLTTPSKSIHWLTADELSLSRLATAWVDRANPILADARAERPRRRRDRRQRRRRLRCSRQGVGAVRRRRSAADRAKLEATFAYRRGGAIVTTTLAVRDAETGAALEPARRRRLSRASTRRASSFAPAASPSMRRRGSSRRCAASASCSARRPRGGQLHRRREPDAPHPAPVVLNPFAADGAAALFDEACPLKPIAARAVGAPRSAELPPPAVSGSKAP